MNSRHPAEAVADGGPKHAVTSNLCDTYFQEF